MNVNMNPVLLMSMVNTYLRDKYDNLEQLCDDLDISQDQLIDNLKKAGFEYLPEINQFR